MSERRLTLEELLEVLGGDESFLEEARAEGLHHDEPTYDVVYCERVRVARTLVRELDVNWPGVQVVLKLREELVSVRRHVVQLASELSERSSSEG